MTLSEENEPICLQLIHLQYTFILIGGISHAGQKFVSGSSGNDHDCDLIDVFPIEKYVLY